MTKVLNAAMVTAVDEFLSSFGLTHQRSVAGPALSGFTAGLVVGAAAALLLAPSSGEALIAKITARAKSVRAAVMAAAGEAVTHGASAAIDGVEKTQRPRSNADKYTAVQG